MPGLLHRSEGAANDRAKPGKEKHMDTTEMVKRQIARADTVLVKMSPMLDIQDALRRISGVREVHVVSADGECKEVLLVMGRGQGEVTYHCVNLSARTQKRLDSGKRSGRIRECSRARIATA